MTAFIQCKFNPNKIWLVTRTNQSKYLINQMIKGKLVYNHFVKTSKVRVSEVTCISTEELNELFK
jgi:hypothetical protein